MRKFAILGDKYLIKLITAASDPAAFCALRAKKNAYNLFRASRRLGRKTIQSLGFAMMAITFAFGADP
jgi:hypothetical protein